MPYIGDKWQDFDVLASNSGNTQASHILAIAQASGAGKTKLCFVLGTHPNTEFFSIFIRFSEFQDQPTKVVRWLVRKIEEYFLNKKDQAERSLHLFRLPILANIHWAMQVANSFDDNVQLSREACLCALQNNDGQEGVLDILNQRWSAYSKLTLEEESNYLAQHLDEINALIGQRKILIFFDEVAHLKNKLSGSFLNTDPRTTSTSDSPHVHQDSDLYYGLKLVSNGFLGNLQYD